MCSFNAYLLKTYYVPGDPTGGGDRTENEINGAAALVLFYVPLDPNRQLTNRW